MVDIFDAALPIISLIIFSLLTIPVFKGIRKTNHKTALTLVWFAIVFTVVFFAVANLSAKYYQLPISESFVNLTFSDTPPNSLSSAFMIDGISIYMAIIFAVVSAAVLLYSIFYVNPAERPSERSRVCRRLADAFHFLGSRRCRLKFPHALQEKP